MKLAVLLVSCSDAPRVTTLTQSWAHRMTNHVAGYYLEESGGREVMEFRVFDWCALPVTSAQWNDWGFDAGDHVRPIVSSIQHVDLTLFDHWVFVIDKADAHLGATRPSDRLYAYLGAQDLDAALLAHELGHMFNANHARLETSAGIDEYGDSFCIMGAEGGKFSFAFPPLNFTFEAGQPDWRYCLQCQSMFFDGYPQKGACPGGPTGHRAAGYNFVIPHDVPGPGQPAWRYCQKCHAMFFDGYPTKGVCPAGGAHVAAGYNFVLPHDAPGPGQADWRFCHRCMSLFFDGYPTKGRCAAGRDHEAQGYNFRLPHDVPPHWLSGPSMVAPTLAACSWLDLGDSKSAREIGGALSARPAETVVELAALSGAAPIGYWGPPLVVWADNLIADQRLLIEYRSRKEYDQGLPATDAKVPGWVLMHLSTGSGRQTTSLLISSIPAEVGATTFLPHGALNVTVTALDAARDTAIVRVSSESWPPGPGQANWRFCRKCQSMFFDGYPSKGNCVAGGTHAAAGFNFVLQHDVPGDQGDWHYCRKCEALFFDGYPNTGRCAINGHVAQGYNFHLPHDIDGPGQPNWRFCSKCQSIFFDGYPTKGVCSAGGPHVSAGFNFVLPHDAGDGQADWRYCQKCQAMFFDGYPDKGLCPAGGGHDAAGYNFHLPHDAGDGQADWRYCRNCHVMFYDGYDTKGVCPAPGHEAAGFNFVIAHDSPGPGQTQWRYCSQCYLMFYDGYATKGRCAVNKSGHVAAGYNFRIEFK